MHKGTEFKTKPLASVRRRLISAIFEKPTFAEICMLLRESGEGE